MEKKYQPSVPDVAGYGDWEFANSGLSLTVPAGTDIEEAHILFHYWNESEEVLVTARDTYKYEKLQPGLLRTCENPFRSVVEVGAGLGGLTPFLAEQPRPELVTVIDPADYSRMSALLEQALGMADELCLADVTRKRIMELRQRCHIILDPTRVRLINKPLGRALREDPSLHGSFDLIVDNCGAGMYSHVDMGVELYRESPWKSRKGVVENERKLARDVFSRFFLF